MAKGLHSSDGYFAYARSYLSSGNLLFSSGVTDTRIPALYLTAHSIELALKSFLLSHGIEASTLANKPFWHDVEYCLNIAISKGFDRWLKMSEPEFQAIKLLSDLFKEKKLNYLYESFTLLPNAEIVSEVARRILDAAFSNINIKLS